MKYTIVFFIPFLLSLGFTPIVRLFAIKHNLISYPRIDRWHKKPTALLGGVSIYLASAAFLIFLNHANAQAQGLFFGATFLFIIGLADDKFHFTPYTKLFAQIVAGCIAIFYGITLELPINDLLVIPLTLLWIIGVTNSFNLLDNIDGLAAGIAAVSSIMLFFSSLVFSNNPLGIYGLVLSGAALGFLPYNFYPAKIFMGDSGSMFLGYSLAIISIAGTTRHVSNLLTTMLVPVLILTVPIFDTIFVMILRKLKGKQIFEGGRDHTSHRLVTLGLSQRKTVLLLYSISIVFGLSAISYSKLNIIAIPTTALLSIVILMFFGLFLSDATPNIYGVKDNKKLVKAIEDRTILNSIILHKRRIVEVCLDMGLIFIAYSSAYFLRFEGPLLNSNLYLLKESLLWVILIKMSVFFIFGIYRGVWRYVSISDLITIFKVVSLGSIASIILLTFLFRFQDYSRTVFFIDWIILLFLLTGTRIFFRVLGEFFSRSRDTGKKVLIFGAGDTGEMVMREIKRNNVLNYSPVGFIDDNPAKIGNRIQGMKVLGSRDKLKSLAKERRVQEVIIAIPSLAIVELSAIAKLCNECGVPYRRIKGILDSAEFDEYDKM